MMKFQQLSAFKAVYELGTMTSAAEHIHVTQPAISRLISSLEHQLGFRLFQRIKGRLVPTDQGTAFYYEVTRAFRALDTLEDSARDIRTHHRGRLHITAFPMLSNSFLPAVLGDFLGQANQMQVSLKSYRSEEVLRRTEIQSCDVGIALIDSVEPNPNVISTRVSGDCVAIVPADSVLADKQTLVLEDLAVLPFIRYESDDAAQQELDRLLAESGVEYQDIVEVSFANVAAMLVDKGVGVAIVDPFTAQHARSTGMNIQVKPITPSVSFHFHILYPALQPVSDTTRRFICHFLNQAEQNGIPLSYEKDAI